MALTTEEMFARAPFISHLGLELISHGSGTAESQLKLQPFHQQQHGFVHAGVQATMADHTAGVAATSLLAGDEQVLSIEFKVNFLRPAVGELLICRSNVLRKGKTLAVAESDVFSVQGGVEKLTAKAIVTLAIHQT